MKISVEGHGRGPVVDLMSHHLCRLKVPIVCYRSVSVETAVYDTLFIKICVAKSGRFRQTVYRKGLRQHELAWDCSSVVPAGAAVIEHDLI